MKKFNSRIKKGFTLAEMLVVLAIVGILITISLPAVAQGNHRRKFDSYGEEITSYNDNIGILFTITTILLNNLSTSCS